MRAVTDLVCVDVRRHGFGEEVRRHSSSLEVEVQSSRVLIGHCKQKQNQGVVTRTDRELVVQYLTRLNPGCNEKKKKNFHQSRCQPVWWATTGCWGSGWARRTPALWPSQPRPPRPPPGCFNLIIIINILCGWKQFNWRKLQKNNNGTLAELTARWTDVLLWPRLLCRPGKEEKKKFKQYLEQNIKKIN